MTKRKQPGEESLTEEKFYDDEWGHATALLRASGGDLGVPHEKWTRS
jgi:hypothetical protein